MRVTLFRDLPTEGWPSMERYADEMGAALRALGCDARPYVLARPWRGLGGRVGAAANYSWRSIAYPVAARFHQGDLNHVLDHSYAHLVRALNRHRTLVTCHDVAPLALGQRGRGLSRHLWDVSFRAMLEAAHIIAGSAFTRGEILRHADYPPERVTVAGYGVSDFFREGAPAQEVDAIRRRWSGGGRPIILHVGSCQPRKNVELVFRSLAEVPDLNPIFVQVGGRYTRAQHDLIDRLGVRDGVAQIEPVPPGALRAWYQAADVFVFPSLYEGFGLPVLEAMAAGAPVICARAAALPEVAGDAALLVDPADPRALAEAIRLVLAVPGKRSALVEAGRARSREFTWEGAARSTLQAYGLVGDRPG